VSDNAFQSSVIRSLEPPPTGLVHAFYSKFKNFCRAHALALKLLPNGWSREERSSRD